MRRQFNLPHLSVSQWAKLKVRKAVRHVSTFEEALSAVAHRHRADGVICGHVHHPAMREDLGVLYINCGDWVESCTAAVEHEGGSFEIVSWAETVQDADAVFAAAEARAA
jgi:UDP-2,3-diacylglucosamine pyrophosphatase LpxH